MKANAKYTVLELLNAAGVKKPEEAIGKIRVRVAGVPLNNPNAVLTVQSGTKKVEVIVGVDKHEIVFDSDQKDRVVSEASHEVLVADGVAATKQTEALQKAKAAAKAAAAKKPV